VCGRHLDAFRISESGCLVARHRPGSSDFNCLSCRISE